MDQIRKQVARARRRLWMELFLNRLVNCWFVALIIAAVAIAMPKFVAIDDLPANWTVGWLGGSMVAGLAVALGWTWLRGRSEIEAAMEIDRRFELERTRRQQPVATAEAAETPAGHALLADAVRAIGRLEIDQRFRINVGRARCCRSCPRCSPAPSCCSSTTSKRKAASTPRRPISRRRRWRTRPTRCGRSSSSAARKPPRRVSRKPRNCCCRSTRTSRSWR